ncbi:MAG: trans-sulfuration enzyme family protein, partial [Planctomycetota bacterium]|jgi:cystathionine beta-lyase/cystathionine gamma-synthase
MAAALSLFWTLTSGGDHIVASKDIYGGTYSFLASDVRRLGVDVTFVDPEPEAVREALRPDTRLVFVETIGNPLLKVVDLPAIAKIVDERRSLLVVDNTFATPVLCRPHTHGAHVVYHSGTKFLGGHSDALSGVATGEPQHLDPARKHAISIGATISPLDAWLTLRGIKTLPLRVTRASENADGIARFLERNRKVKQVHYPGLPSSPSFQTAKKVLNGGFGAVISFELDGLRAVQTFLGACQLIRLVPSLGDVTTTVSHPARSSHAYLSPKEQAAVGVTDGLLRISTGIENIGDILEDIGDALKAI